MHVPTTLTTKIAQRDLGDKSFSKATMDNVLNNMKNDTPVVPSSYWVSIARLHGETGHSAEAIVRRMYLCIGCGNDSLHDVALTALW